jgi:structural maintenance of chromosome 4
VNFLKILDEGEKYLDDYRVVEGSQNSVKRRAFSDNSSKYYLNGKLVKFQEIAKFLRSNGMDLTHNRFLILQGEVEQNAQVSIFF